MSQKTGTAIPSRRDKLRSFAKAHLRRMASNLPWLGGMCKPLDYKEPDLPSQTDVTIRYKDFIFSVPTNGPGLTPPRAGG